MSNGIEINPVCMPRIQPQYAARNGRIPSAQFQTQMAMLVNTIARHRRNEFYRSAGDVTGPISSKTLRFAGHLSPIAGTVVARVNMAPAAQVTQTSSPRCQLALYNTTTGAQIGQASCHFGYSYGKTPNETPDEWGVGVIGIDVSNYRDTSFRATLVASSEARVISCTVYESAARPDVSNGYAPQQVSVGQPILDEDRSAVQDLAHSLWHRGGPTLFTFSSQTDAAAPTNVQAVVRNVVDSVPLNAKQTATPAGFRPDLRHSGRKTVDTVPVKIECYAGMAGAGTGSVFVMDEFLSIHATFLVTGTASWQTPIETTLPSDLRKYYVAHAGTGIDTVTTYALSCYRYSP